ncbi:hypothetical protein FJZ26_01040 [Candidatus Parvarchaeota archaeon]|nr:hypothetical protein [Candidatus Parvarchaeota archaeon]
MLPPSLKSRQFLALLAFFLVSRLFLSVIFPFFIGDEANYANAYAEFAKSGRPDVYGELVIKPAGMFVLSAPFLSIFLPLSAAFSLPIEVPFRITSIIFGALALAVLFLILEHLTKSRTGAAAGALFFSITPNFSLISFYYSPDIFFLLALFLALHQLVSNQTKGGSIAAGLLTGLAFYIKMQQIALFFAVLVPFMLLRQKIRIDYFAYAAVSVVLAILVSAIPYYPNRLTQLWLLVQTEFFTRLSPDAASAAFSFASGLQIHLGVLVLLSSILFIKREALKGHLFEVSQIILLFSFFVLNSFYYTAILFFGPALLVASALCAAKKADAMALGILLLLCALFSLNTLYYASFDSRYDFPSQKQLGLFLAGKYPLTILAAKPNMAIWSYYTNHYSNTSSPALLANMRMTVLPYKFFAEGAGGSKQNNGYGMSPRIHAIYTSQSDSQETVMRKINTFNDTYLVVEKSHLDYFAGQVPEGYLKAASFGERPGFVVFEKTAR